MRHADSVTVKIVLILGIDRVKSFYNYPESTPNVRKCITFTQSKLRMKCRTAVRLTVKYSP